MSTFLDESLPILLDRVGKNEWLNPMESHLIRNENKSQTHGSALSTSYVPDFSKSALPRPARSLAIDVTVLPLVVNGTTDNDVTTFVIAV